MPLFNVAVSVQTHFPVVKFHVDGFVLHFWDVGGNKDLLDLWDRYIEDCHAIVFVIDSCGDEEHYDLCLKSLGIFISML